MIVGLLLAGLVTSCGGSDTAADLDAADSSSTVTASAPSGSTEAASGAPATTVTTGELAVTPPSVALSQTPADSSTPATIATIDTADTAAGDPQFSGDASSPFCDVVRQFDESSPLDTAFGTSTTPEATKASWDEVMKAFGLLRSTAPDELIADVAVTTKFIDAMDRIFVESNYDMVEIAIGLEADPELVNLSGSSPEIDAANERLDAYGKQVCGLSS